MHGSPHVWDFANLCLHSTFILELLSGYIILESRNCNLKLLLYYLPASNIAVEKLISS